MLKTVMALYVSVQSMHRKEKWIRKCILHSCKTMLKAQVVLKLAYIKS